MQPTDLGFDARLFPTYRDRQLEAALHLTTDKRFSLLSAPTGTGKSLIYMTASRLLDARTLILVSTKGLQEQLVADFESLGVADMRGLANYRCVAVDRSLRDFGRRGAMCDEGPCRAGIYCALKHEGGCLYYDAQANARDANIVVTNYSYWMTLGQYSDPLALGNFDLLILDEAHAAPDILSDFCAVTLYPEEIQRLLDLTLPPLTESLSTWVDWARNALSVANVKLLVLQERLRTSTNQQRTEAVHATLRLNDIARGLERLAGAMSWRNADAGTRDLVMPGAESGWVRESIASTSRRGPSIRFTPIWAHAYAEPVLFRQIKKVLLLSATLTQETSKYLGIAPDQMDYREMRSTFDPRRRPLIYVPTVRVDRSMNEGAKRVWVNRIDKVIETRLDRKGIIHTRSYARAREIVERSRYSEHMMLHTTGTLREMVAAFKSASAPAILVSPSVETGFDFPHDECLVGETRVLRRDLSWAHLRDIVVGDSLVTIDEHPRHRHAYRCLRYGTVTAVGKRRAKAWRVLTTHGEFIATGNHPFLARRTPGRNRATWTAVSDLRPGYRLFWLTYPVSVDTSRDGGYLAGFFDGEGHLAVGKRGEYSTFDIGVSQREGALNDYVGSLLRTRGYDLRFNRQVKGGGRGDVVQTILAGRLSKKLEFLSSIRPVRLIEKANLEGKTGRDQFCATVLSVSYAGVRTVYNLQTTTGTFFAEGFATHNCRYQIIAKVPFIDGRSPLIQARAASDKGYLNHVAAITLIQQCGRGMRSESDLAETFIFDDHFKWFRRAAVFPRWFRDSWRVLDVVPAPPPLPNP